MNARILFADDDDAIREVVRILLESEGFAVTEAADGEQAVALAAQEFDLIILDVMMPGISGVSACARIRKSSAAPILFLTAKSQDSDKTVGLGAGGDDYLTKPFSCAELIARVKALLRRYRVYGAKAEAQTKMIKIGDAEIDLERAEVRRGGREVTLTATEYKLLCFLAKNRGRVFSAQSIYEHVWEEPYYYSSNNTVMVHIRHLRSKLGDEVVKTVWGKGYRVE